jgi:hypothetical protein
VDERADPQFRDNWIVARATAFLVSYCLGLETGYVKRCEAPRGLCAHLDHLIGERGEAPAICNTLYVADRSDRVHCGRETCRKTQRIIANEHLLEVEVAKRAEALARRVWDKFPVRGTFTKAWSRAGEDLATFRRMIASS